MTRIALIDTGPLVAALDARDQHHAWATEQLAHLRRPLYTCEAVLTEAFHLLRRHAAGRRAILEMLAEAVLAVSFRLADHAPAIEALLGRYANVPMSLADACLVRMSELTAHSVVFTLDSDFHIYRRHGRQKVPLVVPGER